MHRSSQRLRIGVAATLVLLTTLASPPADAAKKQGKASIVGDPRVQPNILAIWGDDIGWFNLSIHNFGIMGYQTPNLDRIGKEGVVFTDAYAEQSCTAGRAAFLTGQHGLRSGMLKVGLPGVDFGLHELDPTIPTMLKEYGYTTGQFGKNHLGDTNPYLPTNRGFDEFFGNLYHLNAEGEPEHPDYPGGMVVNADGDKFEDVFGPRGVIHSFAAGVTPPDNVFGEPVGDNDGYGKTLGQTIFDTGPLTRHRMKTFDGATAKEAIRFMNEANNKSQPFFTWYAASRMHVWTYLREAEYELGEEVPPIDYECHDLNLAHGGVGEDGIDPIFPDDPVEVCNLSLGPDPTNPNDDYVYVADGATGLGTHPDGMVEHDMYVGQLLDFLDHTHDASGRKLADNTIVMYTSDNGPETFSWPDGGTTPFRSEKATNWEGGYRVPLLVRWPGVIAEGSVSNDMIALQDWFPTLASAATARTGRGRIDVKQGLENGLNLDGTEYRVHLDGYDFYDYFQCLPDCDPTKPAEVAPRDEFIYANDDGQLVGIRYGNWKIVFYEQREHAFSVWQEPFTQLRVPKIFNLRSDPFEKADHDATNYDIWRFDHIFLLTPAQVAVYKFLQTFDDFPPRQVPPSFSVDIDAAEIAEKCGLAGDGSNKECFQPPPPEEAYGLPATGSL